MTATDSRTQPKLAGLTSQSGDRDTDSSKRLRNAQSSVARESADGRELCGLVSCRTSHWSAQATVLRGSHQLSKGGIFAWAEFHHASDACWRYSGLSEWACQGLRQSLSRKRLSTTQPRRKAS